MLEPRPIPKPEAGELLVKAKMRRVLRHRSFQADKQPSKTGNGSWP